MSGYHEYFDQDVDDFDDDPEEDDADEEPRTHSQWEDEPDDPDHDLKCHKCGSKLCEGECVLTEQNSTEYPDTDN